MVWEDRSAVELMQASVEGGTIEAIIDWEDFVPFPYRKNAVPADICTSCGIALTI